MRGRYYKAKLDSSLPPPSSKYTRIHLIQPSEKTRTHFPPNLA
jgi:hypothetical protein